MLYDLNENTNSVVHHVIEVLELLLSVSGDNSDNNTT